MRKRQAINGKVMRTPTLSRYDGMRPKAELAMPIEELPAEFNQQFVKEAASTHDRDRDLLIALGVDGTVPLAQARRNAGLYPVWYGWDMARPDRQLRLPANDNELVAKAA